MKLYLTLCVPTICLPIVTLNPGSGIGFLIQVRTDTGQTSINAAADIWGTFLDMDGDNYQPLQCGINQNMPNNRSNVR